MHTTLLPKALFEDAFTEIPGFSIVNIDLPTLPTGRKCEMFSWQMFTVVRRIERLFIALLK